jgi:hypothetical protein
MRFLFALAAAVLSVSIAAALTVSPAAAAQKTKVVAQKSANQCIDLARRRGYTESDISGGGPGRNPAARFVRNCMAGKQR